MQHTLQSILSIGFIPSPALKLVCDPFFVVLNFTSYISGSIHHLLWQTNDAPCRVERQTHHGHSHDQAKGQNTKADSTTYKTCILLAKKFDTNNPYKYLSCVQGGHFSCRLRGHNSLNDDTTALMMTPYLKLLF